MDRQARYAAAAQVILAVLAVIAALHLLRPILMPIAVAMVLACIVSPVATFFRRRFPFGPLGAVMLLLLLALGGLYFASLTAESLVNATNTLPAEIERLAGRVSSRISELVRMAENEVAQLELDLDHLQKRYLNTWREFAAYLGCPTMPPTRLTGSLEGEIPTLTWEAALDRLFRESPEIKVAELQIRRQLLTLKRERIEPIPDLVLRGGAGYQPSNNQGIGYARIYLEVPLWDRNRGNILTAEHGLREVTLDLGRVRLNLQQRLARDYNHYQTSVTSVRRYREEILPRARRAYELYLKSFRKEDAGYSRVQSSQSAYVHVYINYVNELLELRRAQTAIEGLLLYEGTIEAGTLRPPGSGRLSPPGQGLPHQAAGGGVPVGRPSRTGSP